MKVWLARWVCASPADDGAPLMRLRAAMYCNRIADYFRDQGQERPVGDGFA